MISIFEIILENELDYTLIKALLPHAEHLIPLIEQAILHGVLATV